jgi:hypothetical protein
VKPKKTGLNAPTGNFHIKKNKDNLYTGAEV